MRSLQSMIETPETRTVESNHRGGQRTKHYRVRSFSFNTIKTLLGTRRRTSNTETRRPSRLTTACLMASISSSVCGATSSILDALRQEGLVSSSSSHVPLSAVRPFKQRPQSARIHPIERHIPVMAASKIGYFNAGLVRTNPMRRATYEVRPNIRKSLCELPPVRSCLL